jgi:nitrogen regulatory protein P-II 1
MPKLVRAIVREEKVPDVIAALDRAGVPGVTVSRAHGHGRDAQVGMFRGTPYPVLHPVCVVEVLASADAADDFARVIAEHARTGHKGDGHVFVMSLDESYSVRTRWLNVA